jgi:hypothetical protein
MEEDALDTLLEQAKLGEQEFAEKQNVVVLGVSVVPSTKIGEDSGMAMAPTPQQIEQYEYEIMKIPRRPAWQRDMTAKERAAIRNKDDSELDIHQRQGKVVLLEADELDHKERTGIYHSYDNMIT